MISHFFLIYLILSKTLISLRFFNSPLESKASEVHVLPSRAMRFECAAGSERNCNSDNVANCQKNRAVAAAVTVLLP